MREYTGHTQDTTACVFLEAQRGIVVSEERRGDNEERGEESDSGCGVPASASHRMIATASKDETIKIYDRDSGGCVVLCQLTTAGLCVGFTCSI